MDIKEDEDVDVKEEVN